MTSPTRLANKTIWAIEDLSAAVVDAWAAWRTCHERAKKTMDPVLIAGLSDLGAALATIERRARQARRGEYQPN